MKTKLWRILPMVLALMLSLVACSQSDAADGVEWVEYDLDCLEEYVTLDTYVGLTVTLSSADEAKGEAVFRTVLDRAQIHSYPQEQLDYYTAQERAKYRYLEQEISEETLLADARELVKEDLVYRYILKDTGMSLTEREKTELFDRYVEKYVRTYGYSAEYVRENMKDLVYESMLYDKTMEYLILNNTFATGQE